MSEFKVVHQNELEIAPIAGDATHYLARARVFDSARKRMGPVEQHPIPASSRAIDCKAKEGYVWAFVGAKHMLREVKSDAARTDKSSATTSTSGSDDEMSSEQAESMDALKYTVAQQSAKIDEMNAKMDQLMQMMVQMSIKK